MAASIDNFCKLVVGLRYLILLLTQNKRFYVPSRHERSALVAMVILLNFFVWVVQIRIIRTELDTNF